MSSYLRHSGTTSSSSDEEVERKKMGVMKGLVEAQIPSAKELDEGTIRRFLRARNGEVEKGTTMLVNHLKWRKEFVPNGFFRADEAMGSGLINNELFLQGFDKLGHPIVVVLAANHKPITNVQDFKRYVVYALDKICSSIRSGGDDKFVVILDMKGYGFANNDTRAFISGLSVLQDNYPERLSKLYFVHVPHMFTAAWKIISPFVDKNTKKKIAFLEGKKMKSTILQDIDESQIPEIYGGKLKLVPIQHS